MQPIDLLDLDRLVAPSDSSPRVTILLPTARAGRETQAAPIRLGNLIREASIELERRGTDAETSEALLAPLRELQQDLAFWQQQAEGLALHADAEGVITTRTLLDVPESVIVGDSFVVRPLLDALPTGDSFHVLALSMNKVRLFQSTSTHITELDLGEVPTSEADLYADRDHQQHLQFAAQGGQELSYHGHGADAAADRARIERFLRHVARGLEDTIPAVERLPLVLVGVPEMATAFRGIVDWPVVVEGLGEGNADRLSPAQVHERIAPVLASWHATQDAQLLDEVEQLAGRGRVLRDPGDISVAARDGRVDRLLVATTPSQTHARLDDVVETAVADTVRSGGTVRPLPEGLDAELVALTRW